MPEGGSRQQPDRAMPMTCIYLLFPEYNELNLPDFPSLTGFYCKNFCTKRVTFNRKQEFN
jgi:hypothetical protein